MTAAALATNSSAEIDVTGNTAAGTTKQATLHINAAAGFGTAGRLTGTVKLTGDALIEFASGQITSIFNSATLLLDGAQARIADAGNLTTNSALAGLASNYGEFFLENGAAVATNGNLNYSFVIFVDAAGGGGSHLTIGGTARIGGLLSIGNTALGASDSVTAAGIDLANNNGQFNNAELDVTGNTTPGTTKQATLNITSAAGFGTAGALIGTVKLIGDALIEFASGQIATIAAGQELLLDGAQARIAVAGNLTTNSALTGLANNFGVLSLEDGAVISTGGSLDNDGGFFHSLISIDDSGDGGSHLTVGGTLKNTGTLSIGNSALAASDSEWLRRLTTTAGSALPAIRHRVRPSRRR